jgi:hypothetical protein
VLLVAAFGAHDAQVTLRQLEHARVAITLAVAGFGALAAVAAVNRAEVFQAYGLADQRVDRDLRITQTKCVFNPRGLKPGGHFVDSASTDLNQ